MRAKTIAITGATGFIGRALCQHLVTLGVHVRALVRCANSHLPDSVERTYGDLADAGALQRLVNGAEAVIHCAGAIRGATAQSFDCVNVAGLHHLLTAMHKQPQLARLLSVSSLAAMQPQLSFYAASKQRSEQLLASEAGAIPWVVIRPPAVYGPNDPALLPLWRWMAKGWAWIPGSLAARFSLIYIDDLVSAMLAWLHADDPPSGIYSINDGRRQGYGWLDIIDAVSHIAQRRIRTIVLPKACMNLVAGINQVAAQLVGYAPMLTLGKVCELYHPNWVCANTFGQQYDWRPNVSLAYGIRETLMAINRPLR